MIPVVRRPELTAGSPSDRVPPRRAARRLSHALAAEQASMPSPDDSNVDNATSRTNFVSASWLAGVPVIDAQGEPVGELAHVMLDVPRGTIAFAALSCPQLIGSSDRLLAVPWTALAFDAAGQFFVLHLEPQRLRGAPQRDKSHWLLTDPQLAAEMHAYYGTAPEARR